MLEALSFPLNVFARLQELQEGRADWLHFGVFDHPGEPVTQALLRAHRAVLDALPAAGAILEVGIGLGTTIAGLAAAGREVTGITPETAQITLARRRHGDHLDLRLSRLEDFRPADAGRWSTLLLQESAQYIEPMALFDAAERLLGDGEACIVVMDEFALGREADSPAVLHLREHFIALAGRFGWRVDLARDFSSAVVPTLDYLLQGICRHREPLQQDIGLSPPIVTRLLEELESARRACQRGLRGYGLLRLRRDARPCRRLVTLGEADAARMRERFEHVFGWALSAAEWQWKYGQGRGIAFGIEQDGQLLAHIGGWRRSVRDGGRTVQALQVCDVMIDPRLRRSLARRGPLHDLTASFLDASIGWGRPHCYGFGFPTRRAFRVAERLGLYARADGMWAARWPAATGSTAPRLEPLNADRLRDPALRAAVDGLGAAMAHELRPQLHGERDAAWLARRYAEHPRLSYQLWALRSRWRGRLLGVLVARAHPGHLEWVDWVAPGAAWPALLQAARGLAARQGLAAVEAWVSESQRERLQALGPAPEWRDLQIDVPASALGPGPQPTSQRGRWFLTAGDTDFR
jgi:hypothetical protein